MNQIITTEASILRVLSFRLVVPVPADFVSRFVAASGGDLVCSNIARYARIVGLT